LRGAAVTVLALCAGFSAGCGSTGARAAAASTASVEVSLPAILERDAAYSDQTPGGESVTLRGKLCLPATRSGKLPLVLVVHEWWGRNAFADEMARLFAAKGYAAFAVDMYGEGRTTDDPAVAGPWAKEVRGNRERLLRRVSAAYAWAAAQPEVDASRAACLGFCFGGTISLESAWGGGPQFAAAISFHGTLPVPPEGSGAVVPSVLVLHGADDPFVPPAAVTAWQDAARAKGADWAFVAFGNAVHSFTNPAADGSMNPGAKFEERAARRSLAFATDFLAEKLGR
jgi:dienelactone hydrolase